MLRSMIDRPTVTTICEISPMPRRRSGAKITLSCSEPNRPPSTTAIGREEQLETPVAVDQRQESEEPEEPDAGDVEQEGDHAAERHHLAVGEVGQAGRAEDQRQADRAHGEDEPEPDAVGEALGDLLEAALARRSATPPVKKLMFVVDVMNDASVIASSAGRLAGRGRGRRAASTRRDAPRSRPAPARR